MTFILYNATQIRNSIITIGICIQIIQYSCAFSHAKINLCILLINTIIVRERTACIH